MLCNHCTKPKGIWCERTFRQFRALAALKYDEYLDAQSRATFKIDDSEAESATDASSIAGRVEFQPSLLDSIDEEASIGSAGNYAGPRNLMDDDISTMGEYSDDGGSDDTASSAHTLSAYKFLVKPPRITNLGYGRTEEDKPNSASWSKKLFPNAKPTAAPRTFTAFAPLFKPDLRHSWYNVNRMLGPQMATDWDHFDFQKNINGHYKCPFESCM